MEQRDYFLLGQAVDKAQVLASDCNRSGLVQDKDLRDRDHEVGICGSVLNILSELKLLVLRRQFGYKVKWLSLL
jgi:hypothetical protein